MMEHDDVVLREIRGHVGTLTFNRPEKRNSFSVELLISLHRALQEWADDPEVRTVVFTGTGDKAFSSGFDILSIPTEVTPEMEEVLRKGNPLEMALTSVKEFPYPTIAMLNGYAFGAGCNLALCCDIRVGADDIKMGMPPAKIGLVYHPEGLKQFIEVLGMAGTREIFFTGRSYSGVQLKEMKLVDYLVPRSELHRTTYDLAEEIAANAPLSLRGTKRIFTMLGRSWGLGEEDLTEALRIINEAFNSEDMKEGQAAFLEKRKPQFKGR